MSQSESPERQDAIVPPTMDEFILPVLNFTMGGRLRSANRAATAYFKLNAINRQAVNFFDLFISSLYTWDMVLEILTKQHQIEIQFGTALEPGKSEINILRLGLTQLAGEPLVQAVAIRSMAYDMPQVVNLKNKVLDNIASLIGSGFVLAFDKDLRYVFAKGEFTGTGYSRKKIIGKHFSAVFNPADYEDLYFAYQRALGGQSTILEESVGKGKWFKLHIGPFSDGSDAVAGLVIATSIDELKQEKLELVHHVEEQKLKIDQLKVENGVRKLIERNMQEQKYDLELKNQELEQFAYVASHDLQEPLRMVSSYTQLLGKRYGDKLDDEAKEFIGYAVEGATRMQSLITDLLSYSRVGRKEMTFERINLEVIIEIVKRNLSVLIEETGAEITIDKAPFIQADAPQLVQLFQNLITNAIKFVKPGTKPHIKVSVKPQGRFWRVCVEDNGIGFNMDYKDRIFQIFQRLHGREKYPGTGIGLAICKKIVERHGGQIWAESEPEKGARFLFNLAR